jgi:Rad3-related DNA helicase
MSYKNQDKNIPKMIEKISDIMAQHSDQRGIILPYSYTLGDKIIAGLPPEHKSRVIYHTKVKLDREGAIKQFLENTQNNSVILSPYLNEGFDGKDDIARFLILCKMPYPSLQDDLIRERIKNDQQYFIDNLGCNPIINEMGICMNYACGQGCYRFYNLMTAITLIQMAGRIVRTKNDYGTIYVLDQAFKKFFKKNEELFPRYMIDAIRGI